MKLGLAAAACVVMADVSGAQVTQRVSVSSPGLQGNGYCTVSAITPDGRYVVFSSSSNNLVSGDTNGVWDVFVRDRRTGFTERVSVDSAGVQANGQSGGGAISADGRYVAFSSIGRNLVPGDSNGSADGFVHDRVSGATERVTLSSNGAEGNAGGVATSISADGRYVVMTSESTNLVPGDTNGQSDIFVRDRQANTTELISRVGIIQANGSSYGGRISADGRYVVFCSFASNLVSSDTNNEPDVFVCDRFAGGTITRVNVDSSGNQMILPPSDDDSIEGWISPDGRYAGFYTLASNLVPGDTNHAFDVFLHDCSSGATERVSVDSNGTQGDRDSLGLGAISNGGRYFAYYSVATNLVPGDTNQVGDYFVRDLQAGTTERLSVSSAGAQGDGYTVSGVVSASADGGIFAFDSSSTNLVPGDTNAAGDVFVRERRGGPNFTSLCDPGSGGVLGCPCGNPSSAPGRGCDNSAGTGGAVLSAFGGTYLSSDTLQFTTSGELPAALSILTQWIGVNATGAVFGMGVRCTSGSFKRLYTKAAAQGSVTVPDFSIGEPQVSVRSAALGDTILAGQRRWYLVFYRDPIVLGGCPASSTFNATGTGEVFWSP
jgi:Tol biopolymer transport system component